MQPFQPTDILQQGGDDFIFLSTFLSDFTFSKCENRDCSGILNATLQNLRFFAVTIFSSSLFLVMS
jgi:hypothetical protein